MHRLLVFLLFVHPLLAAHRDPVAYVNPLIGTQKSRIGYGGTMPFVSPPFAMTNWTPQTRQNKISITSYGYEDAAITGFIGTHQFSTSASEGVETIHWGGTNPNVTANTPGKIVRFRLITNQCDSISDNRRTAGLCESDVQNISYCHRNTSRLRTGCAPSGSRARDADRGDSGGLRNPVPGNGCAHSSSVYAPGNCKES